MNIHTKALNDLNNIQPGQVVSYFTGYLITACGDPDVAELRNTASNLATEDKVFLVQRLKSRKLSGMFSHQEVGEFEYIAIGKKSFPDDKLVEKRKNYLRFLTDKMFRDKH